MKAAIGCLIGLVFVVGASAESVLEGRVRLASGEAVASAQVQMFDMTDLQRGAVAQAMTDGRGYFALPLAGLPGLVLPKRFELGANYPNPFNPSTLIPYQLAALSYVRLEVFNLLGQRIATLVEGEQPAGVHTAVWDATDGSGQAVGAGVYLYRLTVGGAHQTGRMVLVDGQAGVSAVGSASVWSGASGGSGAAGEGVPVYGLVVSGAGLAPYVVADLGIQAGMAPVELVVEAHPAGKALGDDDSFSDLFNLFGTQGEEEEEEDAVGEADTAEAETDTVQMSGPKIEGPWLWMIVSTGDKGGPAASAAGIDWLAEVSGGAVTEQQIAQNGAVAGAPVGTKVWTWGKLTPTSDNNITEMVQDIGLGDGYIVNHVAYGWIALDAPQQQNTMMYVGSDDAVKVWLNGVLVHDNPADRAASDYQDEFPITLKRGRNTLLVAVYQGEFYWSGFFGFEDDTMYSLLAPGEAQTGSTSIQGGSDLIVASASVSDPKLTAGQAFTLNVTVQNQGAEPSVATTLRYYRSNNATITSGDEVVGTDAIGALTASATSMESIALTAPTDGRETYFYGACVEIVSGESDTDNNCSQAVPVTVSGSSGASGGRQAGPLDVLVIDRFGRAVNDAGITLVDWEGYIANPAMKYTVKAPRGATTTRVSLSSSAPRVYFNLPSWNGAEGPRKELNLSGTSSAAEFYISIFPDRDGSDEKHSLTIEYRDTKGRWHTQTIDIHVIDQDVPNRALDFDITVDFSHDKTDLFDDPAARADFVQAAEDWVYFFDDMDLDEVPAGQEQSWIWSLEGEGGDAVWNKESYTGFLLYAYGARHTGGGPSYAGGYQSANGETLPLKRSGDIAFKMPGEWGTVGHMIAVPDDEWWKETNIGSEPHDPPHGLYSTSYHEIGHALVFCCHGHGQPLFSGFTELGYIKDAPVRDYYGKYPAMDKWSHFYPLVDPVSRRGAYGGEFGGEMPPGRHILTKGHILMAQAVGYTLRETSPFIPLSITAAPLPEGTSGTSYSYTATVSGGTPAYHWAIESGTLPEGLSIDSFTGTISGIPRQHGTFNFTISVSDCDETTPSITRAVTLIIRE